MKRLLPLFCFLSFYSFARENNTPTPQQFANKKAPLCFMENKGQIIDQNQRTNTAVLYQLSMPGLNVSLKKEGFSYDAWVAEDLGEDKELSRIGARDDRPTPHKYNYKFHRVDVEFIGANPNCKIITDGKAPDYDMYYTTGTPEEGAKVYHYGKVVYKNLYQDIDLEFIATPGTNKPVEYNFIVQPGADVALIKMRYKGALEASLKNGALVMKLAHTELTENIPASWLKETNQQVDVIYNKLEQDNNSITIGFATTSFLQNNTLIIDPTPNLVWGTYYGGLCFGRSITTDASGNVLVTGNTTGTTAIATTGAHQTSFGGGSYDAFIVKFNPLGVRQWGTYYGGSGDDIGCGITTDASGNVLLTGYTTSTTDIATTGAHQTSFGGGSYDAFIVKFNPLGVRQWGTYYGGSGVDHGIEFAIDASGNLLITGETSSTTAIATTGAHQTSFGGGSYDDFIVKFNASGVRQWGTYYGGSSSEYCYGIATDASGNVLVTGGTYSTNAIATTGAHQTTLSGSEDAFIVEFNALGVRQWGTYYGGSGVDQGNGITTDTSGNVLVTGYTNSTTAIATTGAHQTSFGGYLNDAFIVKFNPLGMRQWGTYYGGTGDDLGYGITTDASGNVLLTGNTTSTTAIATTGAHQTSFGGGSSYDAFIVEFNALGVRQWGTYYGGTGGEYCFGIATDATGNVLVTGYTNSITAIATTGAHQTSKVGGSYNAFIAKFISFGIYINAGNDTSMCSGNTAQLGLSTQANHYYSWSSNPSGFSSSIANPMVSPLTTTSYFLKDSVDASSIGYDTVVVTVIPLPTINAGADVAVCTGNNITLNATSNASNIVWNNSVVNNQSFLPTIGGNYIVTATSAQGCVKMDTVVVTVNSLPNVNAGANQTVCYGNSVTVTGSGTANNYSWSGGITNNQSFIPTISSNYILTGIDSNGCTNKDTIQVTVNPLPTVNAGTDQTICFGNAVTLAGTGVINYSWSGGVTNNQSFIPSTTSNYVVIGTDTNGCSNKDTVLVTVNQLPNVSGGTNQTVCAGFSITLSGSGANNYSWSNGIPNGQQFVPITTQTYTVTGTDINGCVNTAQTLVTVYPLPIINAGSNQTICTGSSIVLSGSGASTYLWSGSVVNNQSFVPTISGNYVVTGTDSNDCSNQDTVFIVVNPLPNVNGGIDLTICPNTSTILNATGAVNYSWNNGVVNNQSFSPISTNTYVVTGTDANGCINTDTVSVSIAPLPIALITTIQTAICPNGNTTLTASGGLSYLWSNGDTSATTTVNQAGNYYVIAANQYGCTDTSNVITISQKTLPNQLKIKAVGATSVCEPNTVAFVLDMPLGSTTGFAYQWYLSGSAINGATDSTFNANTTGSYALSISGGDNCLKYAAAKTATIKAAPVASFTATTATTFCSGGYVGLVAPSISGCTYTWLRDGAVAGSGNSKIFKLAGNYTVIAKLNGCSDTASPTMPIVVNPIPVASVAALNATTFCAGDSCILEASPAGAVSYEWHNGTFILDTTATEQFKIGITATIKVLVKDANGCIGKLSASSVKTKANAVPLASISSNGSTTISSTGSVKLKATPSSGVTWQWFKDGNAISNATANSYIATSGGSYTVAITKLGCTGTSTPVVVTQTTPKENAVTTIDGSFEMSAYPNPVNEVLTVTVSGIENANGTIQVIDLLGKVVKSLSCKDGANQTTTNNQQSTINYQLSTDNWSSGVYFIRYKDNEGRTGTLKVVKE